MTLRKVKTMELDVALTVVVAEVADLEERLAREQSRLDSLRVEKRGLELAIARHAEIERKPASKRPPNRRERTAPSRDGQATSPVENLNRAQAVEWALTRFTRPVSPLEVAELLRSQGRHDSPGEVGTSLTYLRDKKRVDRVGHAAWVATSKTQGLDPADVEAFELHSTSGEPDDASNSRRDGSVTNEVVEALATAVNGGI